MVMKLVEAGLRFIKGFLTGGDDDDDDDGCVSFTFVFVTI